MSPSPSTSSLQFRPDKSEQVSKGKVTLHLVHTLSYHSRQEAGKAGDHSVATRAPPSKLIVKPAHSIRRVKAALHENWPGKPSIDGIRIIYAGRVLKDDQLVSDIEAIKQGNSEVFLHLIVRPDSWEDFANAPLTPQPRSLRDTGSAGHRLANSEREAEQLPHAQSRLLTSSSLRDPLEGSSYFTQPHLATPSQEAPPSITRGSIRLRDLVELGDAAQQLLAEIHARYHQRYHDLYDRHVAIETVPEHSLTQRSTERSQRYRKLSDQAILAQRQFERNVFGWEPLAPPTASEPSRAYTSAVEKEMQLCHLRLGCISQIMSVLQSHAEADDAELSAALEKRWHDVLADQMIRTYQDLAQPTTPMLPGYRERQQTTQQRASTARPARHTSPIWRLTLRDVVQIVVPLFFLSLKLALLLYVCTPGMSKPKRSAMYVAAVLWVAFTAFKAWKRRLRRRETARRRALRGTARVDGDRREEDESRRQRRSEHRRQRSHDAWAEWSAQGPEEQQRAPFLPRAMKRLTETSIASLEFWRQRLAFYGLEEEDQDLGFRPNPSQVSSWAVRHARQRLRLSAQSMPQGPDFQSLLTRTVTKSLRVLTSLPGLLTYCAYLYFVTLTPQLEELRASEVRRRQRAIKKWWDARGKAWVEAARRHQLSHGDNAVAESNRTRTTGVSGSTAAVVLPRLLRHPYVLAVLDLRPTSDGLVAPATSPDGPDGPDSPDRNSLQPELTDHSAGLARTPAHNSTRPEEVPVRLDGSLDDREASQRQDIPRPDTATPVAGARGQPAPPGAAARPSLSSDTPLSASPLPASTSRSANTDHAPGSSAEAHNPSSATVVDASPQSDENLVLQQPPAPHQNATAPNRAQNLFADDDEDLDDDIDEDLREIRPPEEGDDDGDDAEAEDDMGFF
ncbi:unnamed protein product [Parajaminaea phylloscopi]